MDELSKLFSLLPKEMKDEAERQYNRDLSLKNKNIRSIPPDPVSDLTNKLDLEGIDTSNPDLLREALLKSLSNIKPAHPPLELLPCANVEATKYKACLKPGTKACGACRLVSYCSQECQKLHWRQHKQDCKDPMRSDDWAPAWVAENRLPSFVDFGNRTFGQDLEQKSSQEFSSGISLWGNMPATDVINLARNEKDSRRDFSLAYIASGDLRHVVRTINALPSDYSGNLNILINDGTLPVVCRNVILLLILGTIPDDALAADIALHFWYSAFMPSEYRLKLSSILSPFIMENLVETASPLGPRSTLSCALSPDAVPHLLHCISPSLSIDDVQGEYDRVRTAPSRRDFQERMYAKLRPSHRVAFQEFRRFGIVLPFGAPNAHFNVPNLSLFSPEGKWLQTDYADPLMGWDLDAVIKVGKSRGAQAEDIYGCLYFFLSQELRTFSRRLRELHIGFKLYCTEACQLSLFVRDNILSEHGLPASIRFDRIEVSNILDANYVGMRAVLTHWAPFLARTSSAAIVGYFMNWPALQPGGKASEADRTVAKKLIFQAVEKRKVRGSGDLMSLSFLVTDDIDALYENSKQFMTFLRKQGLHQVLRETELTLREAHTIVPHRIGTPLGGKRNALPNFSDDESWYLHTQITSSTWVERYVEFARE